MSEKSDDIMRDGIPAIIEAARGERKAEVIEVSINAPEVADIDGAEDCPILVVPMPGGSSEVIDIAPQLEAWRAAHATRPRWRKGTIVTHDVASFIEAVNLGSDTASVIFANVPERKVTAILDWHKPSDGATRGEPRFGMDRVEYGFKLSEPLEAWIRASGAPMDQATFSRLIDDRIGDVGEPPFESNTLAGQFAARRGIKFARIVDLLLFTRTIAAKSTRVDGSNFNPDTGDTEITYSKKNNIESDGKPVTPPQAFVISIPILRGVGAKVFNIAVRLRSDIDGTQIEWCVEINALDTYITAAIDEALDVVRGPREAETTTAEIRDAYRAAAAEAHGLNQDVARDAILKLVPLPIVTGCGLPVFMGIAPAIAT